MADGKLTVCATPIGNLGDVSARLAAALVEADVVYAEDTRRTGTLLRHVGSKAKVRSLFVGNERARTDQLVDDLRSGLRVALVSDAGMPSISDPGAGAVLAAAGQGFPVTVVPGPSAVTAAVALSGFGGDRFVFEGFLPRKESARRARLGSLAAETRVSVVFASPNRVGSDLEDLAEALGSDRRVAVMKELTKVHETVWRGPLSEAVERWGGVHKGEFTIVVEAREEDQADTSEAIDLARRLIDEGVSPSDAARRAATETGVSRRAIYQALIG